MPALTKSVGSGTLEMMGVNLSRSFGELHAKTFKHTSLDFSPALLISQGLASNVALTELELYTNNIGNIGIETSLKSIDRFS